MSLVICCPANHTLICICAKVAQKSAESGSETLSTGDEKCWKHDGRSHSSTLARSAAAGDRRGSSSTLSGITPQATEVDPDGPCACCWEELLQSTSRDGSPCPVDSWRGLWQRCWDFFGSIAAPVLWRRAAFGPAVIFLLALKASAAGSGGSTAIGAAAAGMDSSKIWWDKGWSCPSKVFVGKWSLKASLHCQLGSASLLSL